MKSVKDLPISHCSCYCTVEGQNWSDFLLLLLVPWRHSTPPAVWQWQYGNMAWWEGGSVAEAASDKWCADESSSVLCTCLRVYCNKGQNDSPLTHSRLATETRSRARARTNEHGLTLLTDQLHYSPEALNPDSGVRVGSRESGVGNCRDVTCNIST